MLLLFRDRKVTNLYLKIKLLEHICHDIEMINDMIHTMMEYTGCQIGQNVK